MNSMLWPHENLNGMAEYIVGDYGRKHLVIEERGGGSIMLSQSKPGQWPMPWFNIQT